MVYNVEGIRFARKLSDLSSRRVLHGHGLQQLDRAIRLRYLLVRMFRQSAVRRIPTQVNQSLVLLVLLPSFHFYDFCVG